MNYTKLDKNATKLFRQLRKIKQLKSVTYNQIVGEPMYDVVLGTEKAQYKSSTVDAYITDYTKREITESVQVGDSRCIVLASTFKITPAIDDTITYDNNTYTVISFIADPGNPAIELQLRSA